MDDSNDYSCNFFTIYYFNTIFIYRSCPLCMVYMRICLKRDYIQTSVTRINSSTLIAHEMLPSTSLPSGRKTTSFFFSLFSVIQPSIPIISPRHPSYRHHSLLGARLCAMALQSTRLLSQKVMSLTPTLLYISNLLLKQASQSTGRTSSWPMPQIAPLPCST